MSTAEANARSGERTFGFWVLTVLLSLVVAVVGGAIAVGIVALQSKSYQSSAVLAIDQPLTIAQTTDSGEIAKLAALRVKYTGLATTMQFADSIAQNAGTTPGAVHGAIVATAPPESLLLSIGAKSSDPTAARRIATAAAQGLVRLVTDQNKSVRVPPQQRISLRVVTPAGDAVQISPSHNREWGAGGLTALVLFVLAMSIQTLRRRR